jgi:hypothetical protein
MCQSRAYQSGGSTHTSIPPSCHLGSVLVTFNICDPIMYQHASAYNGRGASGPRGAACESSSIAALVDTMHYYHLAAFYSISFPPTGMKSREMWTQAATKKRPSLSAVSRFFHSLRQGNFLTTWISLTHPTAFFGPGIWVSRTWCFVNNSSRRARAKFLRPFNSDRIQGRHVNRDKSHIALSQRVQALALEVLSRTSAIQRVSIFIVPLQFCSEWSSTGVDLGAALRSYFYVKMNFLTGFTATSDALSFSHCTFWGKFLTSSHHY